MYRKLLAITILSSCSYIGTEPIHEAVKAGKKPQELAQIIYSAPRRMYTATVEQMNEQGYRPIHIAAQQGDIEMIKTLVLNFRANLTSRTEDGLTAIDVAERNNNDQAVNVLRTMKLHDAIATGQTDKVTSIIKNHPKTVTNMVDGLKAIHIAARYNRAKLIDTLINNGADVNAKTQTHRKNTPLHMVDQPDAAIKLIRAGADATLRNKFGETPLHTAARADNFKVGEYIIQAGADINAANDRGQTPLHYAARAGNAKLTKILINKGADVNVKDNNDNTPLHDAGTARIAQMLINAGAKVNAQNKRQETPLHTHIYNPDVLRTLVQNGADVSIKDKDGNTPLDEAKDILGFPQKLTKLLTPEGQ